MNRADIQGLLFSGYPAQPASAVLLLHFADGRPNAWLRRIVQQVSSGASSEGHEPFRLNLAFTYRGLSRLRLPAQTLAGFSREFRQGMAHPERSAALGDRAPESPRHWQFTDSETGGVDGVVLIYAASSTALDEKLQELGQGLGRQGLEHEILRTHLPSDGREHFGFRMGVSEPNVRGMGRRRAPGPRIARGEFLLGYRDELGDRQHGPTAPILRTTRQPPAMAKRARQVNFGFNGSYLVLRKLEQRVHAFRAFLDTAVGHGQDRELCAARLVGRWPNGAALALHPTAPLGEAGREPRFGYRQLDPRGLVCPLGAHVRRANPRDALTGDERDSNRHRLLRRGRLYGSAASEGDDSIQRGLLFLALNADLARQFEHVQGEWLACENFAGLRAESDPLLGADGAPGAFGRKFTLPAEPARKTLSGLSHWVRVRGGLYGFLPGLRALGYLADLDDSRSGP